jgi:hypothetical protein
MRMMNRDQVRELLPVLQAFADGKTIQARLRGSPESAWYEIAAPNLRPHTYEYRVKPDKRHPEIEYVYVIPSEGAQPGPICTISKSVAQGHCPAGLEVIEFRRFMN